MSDEFEENVTVSSDSDYLTSGIGDIQKALSSVAGTLNGGINEDYGGNTDTKVPTFEPGMTSAIFSTCASVCDKLNFELSNVLSVGDGINEMDAELSAYVNELFADGGINQNIVSIMPDPNKIIKASENIKNQTLEGVKEDFYDWYEDFAEEMRRQGLDDDLGIKEVNND